MFCGIVERPSRIMDVLSISIVEQVFAISAASIRDVSAGATGATAVAPKFSDTLTLSQPWGADFAYHRRGRT